LPDAEEIAATLAEEQELLKLELEQLHSRAKELKQEVETIWKDDSFAAYELTSVFVHRGTSPSWGHYFFYSRHLPDQPDSWFKYNDSDVSVVSKDEVLADTTGSTANPYLACYFHLLDKNRIADHCHSSLQLVFARKGLDVVDTVNRFIPKEALS
jgi:ubiquitin carboxyl-terminal hydrolase 25/28